MLFSFLRFTADVFPPSFLCAACHRPTWKTICVSCLGSLQFNHEILSPPVPGLEGAAPLLYAFHRTQKLIRHWKEHPGSDLKQVLFKMPCKLQQKLINEQFFAIVPIPQDETRAEKRGHASALEVSRFFSSKLELPILPLLELSQRSTPRMAGRDRFEREFAPNPFQIHREFPQPGLLRNQLEEKVFHGKEIKLLLVDDLMTSGSTLGKAAETLKDLLPRSKIWAGAIGIRPNVLNPLRPTRTRQHPDSMPLPFHSHPENQPLRSESEWQWSEERERGQMHQR